MGKLKWVTKGISFSRQDPPKFTKSVSLRQLLCYPFSLTRFGATDNLIVLGRESNSNSILSAAAAAARSVVLLAVDHRGELREVREHLVAL